MTFYSTCYRQDSVWSLALPLKAPFIVINIIVIITIIITIIIIIIIIIIIKITATTYAVLRSGCFT